MDTSSTSDLKHVGNVLGKQQGSSHIMFSNPRYSCRNTWNKDPRHSCRSSGNKYGALKQIQNALLFSHTIAQENSLSGGHKTEEVYSNCVLKLVGLHHQGKMCLFQMPSFKLLRVVLEEVIFWIQQGTPVEALCCYGLHSIPAPIQDATVFMCIPTIAYI